jgi:hypothetical protein
VSSDPGGDTCGAEGGILAKLGRHTGDALGCSVTDARTYVSKKSVCHRQRPLLREGENAPLKHVESLVKGDERARIFEVGAVKDGDRSIARHAASNAAG